MVNKMTLNAILVATIFASSVQASNWLGQAKAIAGQVASDVKSDLDRKLVVFGCVSALRETVSHYRGSRTATGCPLAGISATVTPAAAVEEAVDSSVLSSATPAPVTATGGKTARTVRLGSYSVGFSVPNSASFGETLKGIRPVAEGFTRGNVATDLVVAATLWKAAQSGYLPVPTITWKK